jgi:hypothetical protein
VDSLEQGYEEETPAKYLSRKQRHHHRILPIYPDSGSADLRYEVSQVWDHTPPTWNAHIDPTLCQTTAELIKLVSDKEEQLQASNTDQIQKLIRSKAYSRIMQDNNSWLNLLMWTKWMRKICYQC